MRSSTGDASSSSEQMQLVSTNIDHPAFGCPKHLCDGRFFVKYETAPGHLLFEYDWNISKSSAKTKPMKFGLMLAVNQKAKTSIGGRKVEIEL